jgi:hypothetical protein
MRKLICKIPFKLSFSKGETIPLFGKEGPQKIADFLGISRGDGRFFYLQRAEE